MAKREKRPPPPVRVVMVALEDVNDRWYSPDKKRTSLFAYKKGQMGTASVFHARRLVSSGYAMPWPGNKMAFVDVDGEIETRLRKPDTPVVNLTKEQALNYLERMVV